MKNRMVIVIEIDGGPEVDLAVIDPHDVYQDLVGIYAAPGDQPNESTLGWPMEGAGARMVAAEWADQAKYHGLDKMLEANGEML